MVAIKEVKQGSLLSKNEDGRNHVLPNNCSEQALRASTKAAEERMASLLEERIKFHTKLEEALQQGTTDRLRLQELLDYEKSKYESSKNDLEKIKQSFESFWNTRLGVTPEEDMAMDARTAFKKTSQDDDKKKSAFANDNTAAFEASMKVAEDNLSNLLEDKAQLQKEYQRKLKKSDLERLRLKQLLEKEKAKHEAYRKELELMKLKLKSDMPEDVKQHKGESLDKAFPGEQTQSEFSHCSNSFTRDEIDLIELLCDKRLFPIDQNLGDPTGGSTCNILETKTASAVLKLMKEQEAHWKTTEDAIDNLKRRLTLVENEKLKLEELVERIRIDARSTINAEAILTKLQEPSNEEDFVRHYGCIYVSPIFEEKKATTGHGAGSDKKIVVEQPECQKDIEIQELKDEIQGLKMHVNEMQRRRKEEALHVKDNSGGMFKSVRGLTGDRYLMKAEETIHHCHRVQTSLSLEMIGSSLTSVEMSQKLDPDHCQLPINECAPHGFLKVVKQRRSETRKENESTLSLDEKNIVTRRSVQMQKESRVEEVTDTTEASQDGMKYAMGIISDNANAYQSGEIQPLQRNKDEHMLEEAIRKLIAVCQEHQKLFPECTGSMLMEGNIKLQEFMDLCNDLLSERKKQCPDINGDKQGTNAIVNGNMECMHEKQRPGAIEETENLKVCLESTKMHLEEEVNKNMLLLERIENQEKQLAHTIDEYKIALERKETTLSFAQQLNSQLANDMSNTETSLAELRSHYKGLVASLETQLKDAKTDLESLQETVERMTQQLTNSEAKILDLELLLNVKDKQVEEIKRRMQAIQNETDATVMEKFDLLAQHQELRKDYDEQKYRLAELVSINEELLKFAQVKEDQLASLDQEVVQLLQIVKVNSDENINLKKELKATQIDVKVLREEDKAFKNRYKFMKAKLYELEYELTQREEALERLTKHLAAIIDGDDCALEGAKQLKVSRVSANEEKLQDQLRQSRMVIDELQEKIISMEAEVSTVRREMAVEKEKNSLQDNAKDEK